MTNVVHINPPQPKQRRVTYKNAEIEITYDPVVKDYRYRLSIPATTILSGRAATFRKAEGAAKRKVEEVLGVR